MKTNKKNAAISAASGPWGFQKCGKDYEFAQLNSYGSFHKELGLIYGNDLVREECEATARLVRAAPDPKRFAEAIEESVNDALRPASPDTFMSLVKRLQDYRAWARAALAKAEGHDL